MKTKKPNIIVILALILLSACIVTAVFAVIYSSNSTKFLNGTFLTTPLWEYLVVSWAGTGVLELAIGIYIVLYMAPRGVDKMVAQAIKEAKNSQELAPLLGKTQEIITVIEPVFKQLAAAFKNLDLEKTQKDFQPLLNALKGVDPVELNKLIKTGNELAAAIKTTLIEKKPMPPLPDLPEIPEK